MDIAELEKESAELLPDRQAAYRPAVVVTATDGSGPPVVTVRFDVPDPLSLP